MKKNFTVTISQIYISDREAAMIPEADRAEHRIVTHPDRVEVNLVVRDSTGELICQEIKKMHQIVLRLLEGGNEL